jgi:hypothetical protein
MSSEIAGIREPAAGNAEPDCGCSFVIDGGDAGPGSVNFCSAPRQAGSAYCSRHRALCHLPRGSAAEGQQLRAIDALANAVGGRQGREARHPPDRLLRRLDRIARAFS